MVIQDRASFNLGAEKCQKEVKSDFEMEWELDLLDTEFAGLVQLGVPEEGKFPLLMASLCYWFLNEMETNREKITLPILTNPPNELRGQ